MKIFIFLFLFYNLIESQPSPRCDCGVIWNYYPNGPTSLPWASTVYMNNGLPAQAATPQQAQFKCYQQPIKCDGFHFVQSQQIAFYFSYQSPANEDITQNIYGNFSVYINVSTSYVLDRYSRYRCQSVQGGIPFQTNVYDQYYIYFTANRALIESSNITLYNGTQISGCPYRNSSGSCCWSSDPGACTTNRFPNVHQATIDAVDKTWEVVAQLWFIYVGAPQRFNPNANCFLQPPLYSDALCTVPTRGCDTYQGNPFPCSGAGYCTVNPNNSTNWLYTTPNFCDCFNYTYDLFGGVVQYMGNACQFSTRDFCTSDVDETSLCSGNNARCRPTLTNNPNHDIDYRPYCECGTAPSLGPWPALASSANTQGPYCETNRCDPDYACQILGAGVGTCTYTNPNWQCVCGTAAVGSTCQYPTSTCKYPGDTVNCRGYGTCISPGVTPPTGTLANFNFTTPWCSCATNVSYGSFCQFHTCNPSVIAVGHGSCDPVTGSFLGCYSPMYASSGLLGSLKCDIDKCAEFGGSVVGMPPTGCNCGNYQNVNQECYPVCGTYLGAVCGPATGGEINYCDPTGNQADTARYANCICGFGYIPIPANVTAYMNTQPGTTPIVCQQYCLHGTVDQDWSVEDPTPCQCAGTGFVTHDPKTGATDYRCGIPQCKNQNLGAYYNLTLSQCVCPYANMSQSDCSFSNGVGLEEGSGGGSSSSDDWGLTGKNTIITVSTVLSVSTAAAIITAIVMKSQAAAAVAKYAKVIPSAE